MFDIHLTTQHAPSFLRLPCLFLSIMLSVLLLQSCSDSPKPRPGDEKPPGLEPHPPSSPHSSLEGALEAVATNLESLMPNVRVTDIREAVVPGLFEVELEGGGIIYLNNSVDYFVDGDLYEIRGGDVINLTERTRTARRKDMLDGLDSSSMIVFDPVDRQVKATVTVFSDIDCGWSRRFHAETDELLAHGIRVRYLAYPRAGIDSPSFQKTQNVWCADNQQEAFTLAMQGEDPETLTCDDPIEDHYELTSEFGVTGTPWILLDDGSTVRGYLPADDLAKRLGLSSAGS